MKKLPQPSFPGIETANENMLAVASGLRKQPMHFDLDLTTARSLAAGTDAKLQFAGNMFYVNANPNDGAADVHFQDQSSGGVTVPFYVTPGFMTRIPYTQFTIENAAQPGKKIRIIYGIDLDFVPGNNSQVQASIVGTVNVTDSKYLNSLGGNSFRVDASQAVSAGNSGFFYLYNPANSGCNLVINGLQAEYNAVGINGFGIGTGAMAGATLLPTVRNNKKGGFPVSKSVLNSLIAVAAPANFLKSLGQQRISAIDTTFTLSASVFPIIAPPDFGFVVTGPASTTTRYFIDFDEIPL
jgi:hypothetical protein